MIDLKNKTDHILGLVNVGNTTTAKQFAKKYIRRNNEMFAKAVNKNARFILENCSTFYSGLLDFIELREVVSIKDWIYDQKAVESAWHLLHDANDRISDCGIVFGKEFLDTVYYCLRRVQTAIDEAYGEGTYVSPEIVWGTSVCSICTKDIKSCLHQTGVYYNGVKCTIERSSDITIKATALVKNPEDPRCRIWPWMWDSKEITEDGMHKISNVPILCVHSAIRNVDEASE